MFLAMAPSFLAPEGAAALEVRSGYHVDVPIEGVRRPTAVAFANTGHVFVSERNGKVKVFDGVDDPDPGLALDITDEVHAFVDRGLLGMALDPAYPVEPYLYLSYTYDARPGEVAPTHQQGPDGSDSCRLRTTGVDEMPDNCVVSGRVSRVELDPATGLAASGALTPNEQPLVTDWCQQYPSHSMGDLVFDHEGALMASGGEGANFNAIDYGQFGNPCQDPPNEGGSLRSQDARSTGDPTGYGGSVIRIDPATGAAWPTNPGGGRLVAFGLRNPFRLVSRPGTTELYIGDVGGLYFDELNVIQNPASQNAEDWASNFGWPCYEGGAPEPGFHALAFSIPLDLCRRLYENTPVNLTPPYFAYPRTGKLFGKDACDPASGAAFAGLEFYEVASDPSIEALPVELDQALLMADAARGCVWAMRPDGSGRPSPSGLLNLVSRTPVDEGAFVPVNLAFDSKGALFMPDFWGDRIHRLRHFEGNQPPVAKLIADPPYGLMSEQEFEVTLDGSQSTDADGDHGENLTFEWDLDEDGEFEVGPSGSPILEHTYKVGANYQREQNPMVQMRVTDPEGASSVDRVRLFPGDLPPEILSMAPDEGMRWTVGDQIQLSGIAIDPPDDEDDGQEPRLDWEVIIRHCPNHCHSHSLGNMSGSEPAAIEAPDHEYPSHLTVTLTATDSRGLADSITRSIHPWDVDVTLESVPSGVPLTIGSTTKNAPLVERLLAGGKATVSAPEMAAVDGQQHVFVSWSDGGDRTHLISRTKSDALVAYYAPVAVRGMSSPIPQTPSVRLRFASRPAGVPLRVGRQWSRAQFTRTIRKGQSVRLAAPRQVRRRGRIFTFSHWRHNRKRVNRVTAARSRSYVAVFKAKKSGSRRGASRR